MPDLSSLVDALGWAGRLVPLVYLAGLATAVDAVMNARTPQGGTAWVFALVAFPLVALPLYWIFGRYRYAEYEDALKRFEDAHGDLLAPARAHAVGRIVRTPALAGQDDDAEAKLGGLDGAAHGQIVPAVHAPADPPDDEAEEAPRDRDDGDQIAFSTMATLPFTGGNEAHVLVDGHATFEALFAALDRAEHYVLTQFYIVHDDEIGQAFAERLLACAARGVRVHFLYDGVGSWKLPRRYRRRLEEADVEVGSFTGPRSWLKKLRLNFRNHRKITVVDGREAFVGGLNVGDEYLGRDEKMGEWRDTHLHLRGPSVQGLQLSFVRDWYFATGRDLAAEWTPTPAAADQRALVLASGPADEVETCGLLYAHAIESAQKRVWIATPYFVPDGRVLGALQLAALRGVDVRVLMPRKSDSVLFKFVPYAFFDDVKPVGVKVHLYEPGFMHQKVALVDDEYGIVGTANFDNRSFRLNFEATVVVRDRAFCAEIEQMLEADFARATELTTEFLENKPWAFRFASQATHLLAPVL